MCINNITVCLKKKNEWLINILINFGLSFLPVALATGCDAEGENPS